MVHPCLMHEVLSQNEPPDGEGHVPADVAAHHLVASSIALIRWWLEHEMPYPPERMGEIYRDLIALPAHSAGFDA